MHLRPRSALLAVLLLSLVACRTNQQVASSVEMVAPGPSNLNCNILMPLLNNLPVPFFSEATKSLAMNAIKAIGTVGGASLKTPCTPDPKATLGQSSLDDIAAIVGTQVDAALAQDVISDTRSYIAELGRYTPPPEHVIGTIGPDLNLTTGGNLSVAAGRVLGYFQRDDYNYLVNFVAAASLKIAVLQEVVRQRVIAASLVTGTAQTQAMQALSSDASSLQSLIVDSRDTYLGKMRGDTAAKSGGVYDLARSFFEEKPQGGLQQDFIFSGMYSSKMEWVSICYKVKPLSGAELALLHSYQTKNLPVPTTLRIRSDLAGHDLCASDEDCRVGSCQDRVGPKTAELEKTLHDKVVEIGDGIQQDLFKRDDFLHFAAQTQVIEANMAKLIQGVQDSTLYSPAH